MTSSNGNTLRGSRAQLAAWCDEAPEKAQRVARLIAVHGCTLARAVAAVKMSDQLTKEAS